MPELQERLQGALGDAYRLEREIGGGGMSRLFLATEASLNRQVVIKLLPPDTASDVSAARFNQEVELAAHLQHPNILPVLTAGAKDDLIYYVMPFVPGESLRQRLTSHGKLPLEEVTDILREVADALAYAHAHGVVHRDIKPENILLQHGHAVLTDFGIARAVAEARSGGRLTATGMVMGTPGYMSPEQVAGEAHLDARADVYSLAIVGYEMLTGQQPFTGPSIQAVMAAHLTEEAPPLRQLRPDTPPSLQATIARALAKKPEERLQTAAEFRDAVKVATGPRPVAPGLKRTRWAVGTGAVAVVALAAVLLWPRGWHVEGDPRRSIIVFPFENRTGDAAHDWLSEASMNLMSLGLAHWEDLRVIDDERTASLLRRRNLADAASLDLEDAIGIARQVGVGTLVLGDLRRENGEWIVESKVHDVGSGDRIMTEIVRGTAEDPRLLFDSVVTRLLSLSGAPPGTRPDVVAQTTRSLEAYRQYLVGIRALFQFQLDAADSAFQHATTLDSTFALAYMRRSNVEGWRAGGGDIGRRRALGAQAERHGSSLPPRFRSLIALRLAQDNRQWARARVMAEQLITQNSSDVEAWYELGEAHYHHGATTYPHADSLGNMGKALWAFERVLALDSSFIVAYRHIVDALGSCAAPAANLLCLADSAVYGQPGDLRAKHGATMVDALRRDARQRRVEVAYAWAAAAPESPAVREYLIGVLLQYGRFGDAEAETNRLASQGYHAMAGVLRAQALLGQRRFREAGRQIHEALGATSDQEIASSHQTYWGAGVTLVAAGLANEGLRTERRLWRLWGNARPGWPDTDGNTVSLPKSTLGPGMDLALLSQVSVDSGRIHALAMESLDTLRAAFGYDSVAYRKYIGRFSTYLAAYLGSRDTVVLKRWMRDSDSTMWRSPEAHLALTRGDSSRARQLVSQFFRPAEPIGDGPFAGRNISEDVPDAYAWADLLARLGELERAVRAYDRLDIAPYNVNFWGLSNNWGLLVRSYAERGALYQQLGNRGKAIEMYQKFVDAWGEGDEVVQPMVERARRALAALRGEVAGPERR